MSSIKSKKFIIPISLALIIVLGLSAISILKPTKEDTQTKDEVLGEPQTEGYKESITIDFDGDGISEILNVSEKEGEVAVKEVNMELLDSEGNKIAVLWGGINLYPTSLYKIVKLNEDSDKEYLQWNMAVGPHQVETVFLTIVDDTVRPVFSIDFENNTMYTPFYTSRGSIVVADANYDGLVEVIENVDEYPVDAPRLEDPEIEQMIKEQFSGRGLDSMTVEGFTEIAKRENYGEGRGRKTILAIHSFVDAETPFFRRLPADEYEEIAGKFVFASEQIEEQPEDPNNAWEHEGFVRYSDLDQDSKDFNDFVRDFWTHGRPYITELPEESAN